jgi:alpha-mannosidase
MNADIKKRIQEGRWEIVGGMWVEPDLNMPDGESLVRQLLVGKRWYQQAYGVDVRIGWNPDSFGYTWQLPQIYKKSGIDYFVTQKMQWNDTNQLPFKLFWWESPDGSKVLSYFPHDYANDNLNPLRLADDFADARKKATGLTDMMDLYGVGDHGGGPTRAILDEGEEWTPGGAMPLAESSPVMPKFEFGTAQPYFSAIEKQIAPESRTWDYSSIAKGYTAPPEVPGKVSIPTWKSELYFEYHRGVMTTQANHKRNMRESSEQVLNAEKWASLAWLDGKAYPADELTEDWKKVLFNQFHDLAAGSGIGVIYKDAQKDYDVVRWSTNEISSEALSKVVEGIDTHAGLYWTPVVVWNPLGWDRTGDITVKVQEPLRKSQPLPEGQVKAYLWSYGEGQKGFPFAQILNRDEATGVATVKISGVQVPALGYKVIYIFPGSYASPKASETQPSSTIGISNKSIHVTVDKATGCITGIADTKTNFDWIAKGECGNQLQFFKDTPKEYDAWNIDPGTLDAPPASIERADSVDLLPGNPGAPVPQIRIVRHWQNSKFVQTIRLDGEIVDVDNEIDWHESHILLKAAFPLAVTSDHATYEIPYGSIERTTKRTNSWEKAQFEVPAQQWADLGDGQHGLSVINDSKFGYDAVGNMLRLTLLRSAKWPDPDADMGHHHFHYALYPHSGTWKEAMTVRHGWEYNYPLQAIVTTAHSGSLPASHSFVSVSPDNVVLTAVKKAEDSNSLIFRVYEWAGKAADVEFHVPIGATAATVTNLMEKPEGEALPLSGDTVKAPIKPFEILTIKVDYPGKS